MLPRLCKSVFHEYFTSKLDSFTAWFRFACVIVINEEMCKCSRMTCILSEIIVYNQIQLKAIKLIEHWFKLQMDHDPKHLVKPLQEFLRANKWEILYWSSRSPDLNPTETDVRKTHKRAAAEGLEASQRKICMWSCPWLQTSYSSIENFVMVLVWPVIYEPPKCL